jgi:N-acetylglucosaminyldiphosphoundecaprenol N-acetyl-beta-D-mannosaminyltransferase
VVTANLHHAVLLRESASFREAYSGARLIVADGMPLVWASRLWGPRLPGRVTGADLVRPLCTAAARDGLSVFLLGARRETVSRAARTLTEELPRLRVAGVHAPPLRFLEDEEAQAQAAQAVRACAPDIVFVGLGAPAQELWARRWSAELPLRAVVCCGAALEFLAGDKRRAPDVLQRLGLEWLFRALCEPRRLAGRYAVDLALLPRLLWEQVAHPRRRAPSPTRR